jgi:NADPH2:quinone reductase
VIAVQMRRYGPPEVLEAVEVPPPTPGAGEVVVRAAVVGVNRADCFIRSGDWPQRGPWPYTPGLETCGAIDAVGPEVDGFREGDRVITMMQRLGGIHGERPGGYQELVCVPARTLARVPEGLDTEAAGALGLPAVTALLASEALDPRPGMRVLVHGGASAVGTLAVQLLRARGCDVLATGTRPEKFDLVRACGATQVVSTLEDTWPEQIGSVDRVFDLVGRATFGRTVGLLAPQGRLVFVGGTSGGELTLSGWDLMKPVTITGWSSESLDRDELQRAMRAIADAVDAGDLRVAKLSSFPLRDAAAAHRAIEAGAVAARVVLDPS